MKGKFKRFVSGFLAVLTTISVVAQPMVSYAAEPNPDTISFEEQYPEMETVKDMLSEDEIVTANDYEIEFGADFDVSMDFSGMTIDESKVRVTYHEAKNGAGENFDTSHADTYKAVYAVEPVSGNPSYRVSRNIIVREPVTEAASEEVQAESSDSGQAVQSDTEESEDDEDDSHIESITEISTELSTETDTETEIMETEDFEVETEETEISESEIAELESEVSEMITDLPEDTEQTTDSETGLTVSDAMEQAVEEGIDFYAMEEGETVTFMAVSDKTRAVQQVSVTRGTAYYYADYGYGSYLTYKYTVTFGNVSATAYCVQPSKPGPGSGTYTITKLGDGKTLAKVCYYGTKASGDDGFFTEENGYGNLSAGARFILVHLAAAYANGGSDAFSGASSTAQALAMKLYNYCVSQPEIPEVTMSFSNDNVKAYVEGNVQRTEVITFKADAAQTITMKLPSGVKLHNETTGKTSSAGASVEICGGTKFYLTAPLTQTSDVSGSWSATMKGSITKDYSAYKITTGSDTQDLALVFGEGVDDEKYVDFKVTWIEQAHVEVVKKDAATGEKLSGAVFGIYSDAACTKLIVKMPATDSKGASSVTFIKTQATVYLKEINAPTGYVVNATAYNVKLVSAGNSQTVTNEEQLGQITVYKTGEVLTGANVSDSGVSFVYEKQKLKGAKFTVTAAENITTPTGTVIYKKGAVVAENLTTSGDGSVTLKNLHLGSYTITETGAPENYLNNSESKTVKLSYAGQTVETVFTETTFHNDRQKAEVSVVKKDKETSSVLAGGVFSLYAASDIKNVDGTVVVKKDTLISSVTTGSDGTGKFSADLPIGYSYYVKETKAPDKYLLNTEDVYQFTFTYTNEEEATVKFSHTFVDEEPRGSLTIYKKGEMLTGASVTDTGVTFQYEMRNQKGAVYTVYAGADIKTATGKLIYQKGAVVADNLVTGEDGSVTLSNLYLGTYTVTEKTAPANFVNKGESKSVTLSYDGQSESVILGKITIQNDRQKASVSVKKIDDTTKNTLAGGVYGLYAAEDIKNADGKVVVKKDTLIEKVETNAKGKAAYSADLPITYSYYIKELQAPNNYVRNEEDVYSFTFSYTSDSEATVSFSHTFENERVNAKINLVKKDAETGDEPQGDATLEKAVYGLYAREDIVHPDNKTGVIYKAGTQVATLTTDENGEASIENLYFGKYYVKEISPSNGYLLDETEYDLTCDFAGDMTATVEKTIVVLEQVKKQPFQLIKVANNGKTDADLLSGVGFTAYLESSLSVKSDGSYDFDSAEPVVIGENGATEIFTNEEGYAVSIAIPFGTYIVRETTTPHNFKPVDDFTVRITENNPTKPQTWRVLLDDEFKAKLKIIKQDDETKKSVLVAGTEFKVFDIDNNKYVEQVTTYPTTVTHKSYFTDSEGYLILPENLLAGNYRIEEITAPDGYTINNKCVEIKVDTDTMYQMDSTSGDAIIEVVYENHPVKGELEIVKKGEILSGYSDEFQYTMDNLAGATFEVYAAEDIFTADHQKDANDNRILEYAAGTLVATLTTDEYGKAVLSDLPLGTYKVVETTAPDGFVLNSDAQEVSFVYVDQNTPVVSQRVEFVNDRQKVEISVVKKDAENDNTLADAKFGLYAKENITVGDQVIVEADTLLGTAVTGADGKAVFTLDVPFGSYYVKELEAPAGFVSSEDVIEVTASYQGQDIATVKLENTFKNQPTTVEFTKSDVTTGVELDGATLTVLDKKGNEIDKWVSVKGEPHVIRRLTAGETYILREELAPYGYLQATDVEFTVADTAEVQKVEMKDEVPTGLLIINKKGEFLDKVTLLDNVKGTVEHLFEYVTGNLTEVTFEIYAAEDIKAADGVSDDYYKADELVATITTDENGIAQVSDLSLGKYYVKEVETASGYVLDDGVRYVDLSYRDQNTAVVTYNGGWLNDRQKVTVNVLKKEKDTDRVLAGGVFGLFAAEDIKSASGKVLIEADEIIELKTTDANGTITFVADLPVDTSYYVKELYAPNGFVTDNEQQEFTFEYQGDTTAEVTFDFTFENEATTVEITKSDLTNGQELPGAKLQVTDEDGKVVDSWTSSKTAHVIKELVVGKKYTLTETKPADGYVTAESIDFVIENTAEIQKIEMKDDVTKVEISKQDIAGKELPGATLTILDANGNVVESWVSTEETHYIEMLPIGEYTLREEIAPDGYQIANDVKFEVKDTAEIQHVTMVDEAETPEVTETPETTVSTSPKTGDETNFLFWFLLAGGSMMGLAGCFMMKKKR